MRITHTYVEDIFKHLEAGDADGFFSYIHPDVDWTVMGTHPLAGRYQGAEHFRKNTFVRLGPCLAAPIQMRLQSVFIENNTAIVELQGLSTTSTGWHFDNRYCWIMTFEDGLATKVRAYLDSAMVARLVEECEG